MTNSCQAHFLRHSTVLWTLRSLVAGLLVTLRGLIFSVSAEDKAGITPGDLAAVKAAEAARIRTIESVSGAVVAIYGNDRHGRFDYFEADREYGILLELLDMPEVYGQPDYVYPER